MRPLRVWWATGSARAFSDRWLELAPSDLFGLSYRVIVEYETGDPQVGTRYLDRLAEMVRERAAGHPIYSWGAFVIVWVHGMCGDTRHVGLAEADARRVAAVPDARRGTRRTALEALAFLAIQRGDADEAQRLCDALGGAGGVDLSYPAKRMMGNLARTAGRLDQALAHFRGALPDLRRLGLRPELAWTCHDCAVALLERDAPGDREEAVSLLDEGLAITRDLGMPPLMERILSRREILKA